MREEGIKIKDVKHVYLAGAMGSCCELCATRGTCQSKTNPINGTPCISCSEYKKEDKNGSERRDD